MIRTIVIGSCVLVQGTFVRAINDGLIAVKVGDKVFSGPPVATKTA